MACIKHTPCQHDSHDHNVMIYVEVSRFSANWRAIRSRGCPLDSGKEPVRFVPLSGPKLARRSREQAYGPDHGEILITQRSEYGTVRSPCEVALYIGFFVFSSHEQNRRGNRCHRCSSW